MATNSNSKVAKRDAGGAAVAAARSPGMQKASAELAKILESPQGIEQIRLLLPPVVTAEFFVRAALATINKTPKLRECNKASVFQCLLDSAMMGIAPDGQLCHLIPYKDQCTLIIDYKGMIALVRRSGYVVAVRTDVVCENDDFVWDNGRVVRHVINFKRGRGLPVAFYCETVNKHGQKEYEIMSADEVESVRQRSRAKDAGPWRTDPLEMGKKTVLRRHMKKFRGLDARLDHAALADGDRLAEEPDLPRVGPVIDMPAEVVEDREPESPSRGDAQAPEGDDPYDVGAHEIGKGDDRLL